MNTTEINQYSTQSITTEGEAAVMLFKKLDDSGVTFGSFNVSYSNFDLIQYQKSDVDKFKSISEKVKLANASLENAFTLVKEKIIPHVSLVDGTPQFTGDIDTEVQTEITDKIESAKHKIQTSIDTVSYLPEDEIQFDTRESNTLLETLEKLLDLVRDIEVIAEKSF